jgi:hypothetical protein
MSGPKISDDPISGQLNRLLVLARSAHPAVAAQLERLLAELPPDDFETLIADMLTAGFLRQAVSRDLHQMSHFVAAYEGFVSNDCIEGHCTVELSYDADGDPDGATVKRLGPGPGAVGLGNTICH